MPRELRMYYKRRSGATCAALKAERQESSRYAHARKLSPPTQLDEAAWTEPVTSIGRAQWHVRAWIWPCLSKREWEKWGRDLGPYVCHIQRSPYIQYISFSEEMAQQGNTLMRNKNRQQTDGQSLMPSVERTESGIPIWAEFRIWTR